MKKVERFSCHSPVNSRTWVRCGPTVCRSRLGKHAAEILHQKRTPYTVIPRRCSLDVIYARCCGLDVHKKTVVACLIRSTEGQPPQKEGRTFRTMTVELLARADWLHEAGCTHVALESTGV
jgi:hypothetical protein